MTRFTRTFAFIGAVVMAATTAALVAFLHAAAMRDALALAEDHNFALARTLANAMREPVDAIAGPVVRDVEAQRRHPLVPQIHQTVVNLVRDLQVVKVKIYSIDGITVFSTEEPQIGERKGGNAGFRRAIGGEVVSELTHRDQFSAFEGVIENRDLLASYIPIYGETGSPRATSVFEIYYDATDLVAAIEDRKWFMALTIVAGFLVVYFVLLVVVHRAQAMVMRHHDKALALAAQAAEAASASRTKSEFLANMSHELRTPLNAILGFSDIIRRKMFGRTGNSRYRDYAHDIHGSAAHLLDIINDILDLARIEAGKIEVAPRMVDAAAFARHALSMVQAQAEADRIALKADIAPDPGAIVTDERRLLQVVLNLLTNAVKFTPGKGLVTLSIRRDGTGQSVIQIADTGIGMKSEDIPRAMEPFSQVDNSLSRRHQGTGLGLSLALRFVELLGGRLSIVSTPGHGTTATITLPATALRILSDAA
jgi:signal transduction histidine kinase